MIAIHQSKTGYHPYWIEYCKENQIPYKEVNCYSNDIVSNLKDCSVLMWHHHHSNTKDIIAAKQILYAASSLNLRVFPDFQSNWHFDDKLGQKYLLEAIEAPMPKTSLFFDKESAYKFINTCNFPIIHKLRHGASSQNVRLVKNKNEAKKLVNRTFSRGISNYNKWSGIVERYHKWSKGKTKLFDLFIGIARTAFPPPYTKILGKEIGYIYFQEFIPNLNRDYRLKVVDNKCWGYQRPVRKGDFRASGSGGEEYILDETQIPVELVKLSFELSKKLKMNSVAFDFLIDSAQKVYLIEISALWGFTKNQHLNGYWDNNFVFHKGTFNPFGWMVEMMRK